MNNLRFIFILIFWGICSLSGTQSIAMEPENKGQKTQEDLDQEDLDIDAYNENLLDLLYADKINNDQFNARFKEPKDKGNKINKVSDSYKNFDEIHQDSYTDFNELLKDVLAYQVSFAVSLGDLNYKMEKSYPFYNEKIYNLNKRGKIVSELISLAGDNFEKLLRKDTSETLSPLEELYYQNLGDLAEQICDHISKTTSLPQEIDLLRQIYKGETVEITKDTYPDIFLRAAYRIANQVNNHRMVEKLYVLSGVQKQVEDFKNTNQVLLSPEFNYIHEPYWIYNIIELKEYGKRIINKIKPYFLTDYKIENINKTLFKLRIPNEKDIKVRKVPFGYVLPNLYLKKRLKNDLKRGVPRIFIVPKPENKDITITFKMPYSQSIGLGLANAFDTGDNALQVFCDNFEIYQEFIEGVSETGDTSFSDLGHFDFNAKQIVKSPSGKKYLIDTKEQKNFFMPYLHPLALPNGVDNMWEIIQTYKKTYMPNEKDIEEVILSWKRNQHKLILDTKSFNFDPRVMYVTVQIGLH